MVNEILKKIFGTKHEREMKRIQPVVDRINSLESTMQSLSDSELQAKTTEFKNRYQKGETLEQLLPEAFAACREASKRVLGMRHYDVQLIGGYVLNRGSIAEMRTGEGKTLVATLAVYLNAISGKGVHVVTVNDYLARRDAEWMGRLYNWMGLSVGIIVHDLSDAQRKAAYNSDITYATNNELGFDYLRDNMKFDLEDMVQRQLNFAIVDECDSILIDEARTPLIISGPSEASTDKYAVIDQIIPKLEKEVHFKIEEKSKSAMLTDEGNAKVEELLNIENLYDPRFIDVLHHVNQALRAHYLYKLDVDYMVKNGEIVIVDEFTGRLMTGRRWSDGLHQAIEAKERVAVKNENQTLASITFQNYFRMYSKLAGMTGTADTEAEEFRKIYNLEVSVIPTNRPIQRLDLDDVVYKTEKAKFNAIIQDIKERHEKGQPILIGTASIEKSEMLSSALRKANIKHNVLNAKQHEREAEIVAQAGRKGAITIATNMAGRGTDIVLGGNAEMMAKQAGHEEGTPEFEAIFAKYKPQCSAEKQEVLQAGGLYIIGTERHESRRIDNQLRGRSGRQGDPGGSKFYLAFEDNLMRIFHGEMMQRVMNNLNVPDDEPITAKMVTRSIEGAQRKVEGHNFDIRKHLLDYDNIMNQQRNVIYGLRKEILYGQDLEQKVKDMLGDVANYVLDTHIPEKTKPDQWNLESFNNALTAHFAIRIDFASFPHMDSEIISNAVSKVIKDAFERQKQNLGQFYDQVLKMILLQSIDFRWKEHLQYIDRLKDGINLRAHAQKDPLIEYKKEAFNAFEKLIQSIKNEVIEKLMRIQLVAPDQASQQLEEMVQTPDMDELNYSGANESDAGGAVNIGSNTTSPAGASSAANANPENGRQRMKMVAGPGQGEGRSMNRSERRKMEKGKRP